jgi:hypothetical protein
VPTAPAPPICLPCRTLGSPQRLRRPLGPARPVDSDDLHVSRLPKGPRVGERRGSEVPSQA